MHSSLLKLAMLFYSLRGYFSASPFSHTITPNVAISKRCDGDIANPRPAADWLWSVQSDRASPERPLGVREYFWICTGAPVAGSR
ncbi:hypothetical protein BKA61DRAFT_612941 [Leptodontidium sp. MPI-SDFR-AT-0119]|nr:hypothetical protein BKA61DRAFT_612941 [Leptodontidium sp. MPI-SDFR-AT-0119]